MNRFKYRYQQIKKLLLSDIYILFISLILLPLTALALKTDLTLEHFVKALIKKLS